MEQKRKWLVGCFGAVVILGAAGWTVWNAFAGARLRTALVEVEVLNLPTRIGDMRQAPVPDGENAALLLNQAFLLMAGGKTDAEATLPALKTIEGIWSKKDPRRDIPAADAAALKVGLGAPEVREIVGLLQRAARRPRCDFGLDFTRGAALPLPHLAKFRLAVRILSAEAWMRATAGDAGGALDAIRDGFRIGGFPLEDQLLISFLVAASCDTMTLDWAGAVLAKLTPSALDPGRMEGLAADVTRRRTRVRPAFVRTIDMERVAFGSWAFEGLLTGRMDVGRVMEGIELPRLARLAAWVFCYPGRSLLKSDYAVYLGLMTRLRAVSEKEFDAAGSAEIERLMQGVPRTAFLTRMAVPAIGQCYSRMAEYEALLDVARVGLALEMHRRSKGAYPERLDEIRLGPCGGKDLFTGRELAYKPRGAGCRVYSLGADGKDNGGTRRGGGAKEHDVVWEVAR